MIIEEITSTDFHQHTRIVGCEKPKCAICIHRVDDSDPLVEPLDKHGIVLARIRGTTRRLGNV